MKKFIQKWLGIYEWVGEKPKIVSKQEMEKLIIELRKLRS